MQNLTFRVTYFRHLHTAWVQFKSFNKSEKELLVTSMSLHPSMPKRLNSTSSFDVEMKLLRL